MLNGVVYFLIILLVGAIILILKKEGGTEEIVKDLFSSRTIFAFIMYATFAYLAITGKVDSTIVSNAVFSLMSFYYGMKIGEQTKTNGGIK